VLVRASYRIKGAPSPRGCCTSDDWPQGPVAEAMRIWLRSLVNAILGKAPGKTGRLDTATRMMIDADFSFSCEPKSVGLPRERRRDDGHLVKPIGPSTDTALFEQLVRVVNEAQERDAKDERRLYDPLPRAWPSFPQPERLDPLSGL